MSILGELVGRVLWISWRGSVSGFLMGAWLGAENELHAITGALVDLSVAVLFGGTLSGHVCGTVSFGVGCRECF